MPTSAPRDEINSLLPLPTLCPILSLFTITVTGALFSSLPLPSRSLVTPTPFKKGLGKPNSIPHATLPIQVKKVLPPNTRTVGDLFGFLSPLIERIMALLQQHALQVEALLLRIKTVEGWLSHRLECASIPQWNRQGQDTLFEQYWEGELIFEIQVEALAPTPRPKFRNADV